MKVFLSLPSQQRASGEVASQKTYFPFETIGDTGDAKSSLSEPHQTTQRHTFAGDRGDLSRLEGPVELLQHGGGAACTAVLPNQTTISRDLKMEHNELYDGFFSARNEPNDLTGSERGGIGVLPDGRGFVWAHCDI